jgi:hypothetical protein
MKTWERRSEVLTAVAPKSGALWGVTPWRPV